MRKTLDTKYDHLHVEMDHYKSWIDHGYFTAGDKSKDPFCIVIPPPNVTGKLHLGHCLLYTSSYAAWIDSRRQEAGCKCLHVFGTSFCCCHSFSE